MRALSTTEILSVWERGNGRIPLQRALMLLAVANPERSFESLKLLSIGQRDAQLLTLRELTFGEKFTGLANCPACNEKIELTFTADDLRTVPGNEIPPELTMQIEGRELRLRLPNSGDLLAARTREELLGRCVLSGENSFSPNSLRMISEKISAADPLADVQMTLRCTCCGHQWHAAFDIVAFFWRELAAAAQSSLREVHALAAAYGWPESEILALTPARRRLYLEMVNG